MVLNKFSFGDCNVVAFSGHSTLNFKLLFCFKGWESHTLNFYVSVLKSRITLYWTQLFILMLFNHHHESKGKISSRRGKNKEKRFPSKTTWEAAFSLYCYLTCRKNSFPSMRGDFTVKRYNTHALLSLVCFSDSSLCKVNDNIV